MLIVALADYRRGPGAQLHADKWERRQHHEGEVPSIMDSFAEDDILIHNRCMYGELSSMRKLWLHFEQPQTGTVSRVCKL